MVGNSASALFNSRALQIGNNDLTDATAYSDMRHFVHSDFIGISSPDNLYRMTVRARDLGGNSASSVANGNRFSAGITAYRHDFRILGSDSYANTYDNAFWFVSHKQSIDDQFYTYVGYFGGVEDQKTTTGPYDSNSYGNGGRIDLPTGTQKFNSLQKALDGNTKLPFNTTYIVPTFKVNEPGDGAAYSQGITEIDYISLDEMTALQTQEGNRTGAYLENSRSLLSVSSNLQDNYYWQLSAYDIRTKQQMGTANGYGKIVRDSVHPAGMKMFGTKISESDVAVSVSSEGHLEDTFSPDQFDSLAAWWRADAISPQNVEYKKYDPASTSNGIYGTERNRFPVGLSSFEDLAVEYDLAENQGWTTSAVIVSGSDDAYFGNRSLKITDRHTGSRGYFVIPTRNDDINVFQHGYMENHDDYEFPVVVEPHKKWLFSFYGKVSNTTVSGTSLSPINSFDVRVNSANTSGSLWLGGQTGNTFPIAQQSWFPSFEAENTWERKSMVFDLTLSAHTRLSFAFYLADRGDFNEATGNTTYHVDGFMFEEYDPAAHGTVWGQHTPSPYLETGLNGGNVISWFDQSPNKHHVYANTQGGFYAPQYIASAVNGKPAVRFSANTVKNTGNVYQYSSIGGTSNSIALEYGDATNFKPPTSGLQSKITGNSSGGYLGGTLSSPSLPRPVANSWTVLAVVKSNLVINSISYATSSPTIFNSGYAGNEDALYDSAGATGAINLGYRSDIADNGALRAGVVNSTAGMDSMETNTTATFTHESPTTNNTFRIVGVSVNAVASGDAIGDVLNFHIDGRRYSNSDILGLNGFVSENSGMDWLSQNTHVTSIGKWAPGNTSVYPHGTHDWDGDIAEILVFNEKLSNNNIAKVEGYLAHKYGLQDNLNHKEDDGSGSPEIENYRWEFANTAEGWDFYLDDGGVRQSDVVDTSGFVWTSYNGVADSNNEIQVDVPSTSGTANLIMEKSTAVQFDGAAYDTFKIRFTKRGSSASESEESYLVFKDVDGNETSMFDQRLDHTGTTGDRFDHTVDLSGTAAWKTKRITNLKYVFDRDANGGANYDIDFVSISGNSHPHPYGEVAPNAEGSNNWNLEY